VVYLFTAGKQAYYARLGWTPLEHTQYRAKEIVIMRRDLGPGAVSAGIQAAERAVLENLDGLVASPAVREHLAQVAERVTLQLTQEAASLMAWEPLRLEIYGEALPKFIRSSWVFALRAGVTTGAERHPNSHQRMMSLQGAGDLQTGGEGLWRSQHLVSDNGAELLRRWATIPPNVWHQAVVPSQHWIVVSFHTVAADELIEERPDLGNAAVTVQRRYID
jgi:hypothetical protein